VSRTPAFSLPGIGGPLSTAFLKLELKLDSALTSLEHKLGSEYQTSHQLTKTFLKLSTANSTFLKLDAANSTFLKIDDANTDFLKLTDANTNFLKITDANTNFLKLDTANSTFLKIDDANSEFLKVGGTAANAGMLGGLTPDAFVHGAGNVVTNEVTAKSVFMPLFTAPPLSVSVIGGDGEHVQLLNGSSTETLTFSTNQANATPVTLAPGASQSILLLGPTLTIQVFDAATPTSVWTITISAVGNVFVGQLLTGAA
jgi:hypothetical protein